MLGCVSYLLRLFVVGFCAQSVWSRNCIPPGRYNLVFKPCMKDRAYRLIPNVSFSDCVRSCMLRSRCQSVMYWHRAIVCGLVDVYDVMNLVTTTGTRSICTYESVVSLDRSILGTCETHTCAYTQTCTVNSSGSGYTCVFSECPPAPEVNNAQVVTNFQEIRGRVWYECKPGFKNEGKRTRLCRENATWSEMDGGCGVTCPKPKEIKTANMIDVVGEKWRQNTVVMFECKPGYECDQNNTQIKFTCNQYSSWSSGGRVPCCKPGWTINTGRCWQYFNGSGINNKIDMHQFCAQQNSSLMVRDSLDRLLNLKQHLLEPKSVTQTIINQLSVGVFDDKILDIKNCIIKNGMDIPDIVTTYADVIAFGQQHNQASCLHIDMWAPGQPDTNCTSDTCTAYGDATGYRMITVSCMWDNPGEYGFVCEAEHVI